MSRRVAVLVPNGFPKVPTYVLPDDMRDELPVVGARLAVPWGARLVTGVLAAFDPPPAPEGTTERDVAAILDEKPFLPAPLVDVLIRAASYYVTAPGEMLRAAVPSRLLAAAEEAFVPTDRAVGAALLDPVETAVLELLLSRGRARFAELAEGAGKRGLAKAVRRLVEAGLVRVPSESLRASRAPTQRAVVAREAPEDHPAFKRSPRRRALHAHLLALGRPASVSELRAVGGTPALLSALEREGLVVTVEEERKVDLTKHVGGPREERRVSPTPAQAAAIDAIAEAVASHEERAFLLHGVTGSGKTEVYLAALEAARRAGRRGILLVPEIALAPMLVRRVVARFGDRVSLLHSGLSDGERAAEWERARRGEVDAVVGPRSAVFAPLPDLGLVVLDEAHDGAYKQGEAPRYDARDVARVRANAEGATLVFGSATPSMELEEAARAGRLPRLALPERPGNRGLARVEVVDIGKEAARAGDHGRILFATRTIEALRATFERGEQAILLLNRRGFAPSLLCRACGEDFRCRNCSVARTYHRRGERLLCHYCGDAIRRPASCPTCRSDVLMPIGFGTERLADRFEEIFPGTTYAVLDRDSASRRGGAARVLDDFESGRAQALLGTQMVAKGHDFPKATALAVLDADALLSFPDFRAAERTFQLVTQAAGRIGRGEKPGVVLVQTARPGHEAIRHAAAQDTAAFAEGELRFRRAFRYPPFSRLLLALFTHRDAREAEAFARRGAEALLASPASARVRLFGPAPAPIDRIKGVWRFHLLVKGETRDAIAAAGKVLAALAEPPRIDVDPQNLL